MGRLKVSEEYKRQVAELYASGLTAQEVHDKTGHARRTVTKWAEEFGIPVFKSTDRVKDHDGLRTCMECNTEKILENEFYLNSASKTRMWVCKECIKLNKKKHYAGNREEIKALRRKERKEDPRRHRQYDMRKRFKIGYTEFDVMFEKQGKKCAGCGTTESGQESGEWHIDHDHRCCPARGNTCGKCIRGILCRACNLTLGNAQDNIERLRGLTEYLENYQNQGPGA
jgi:hypothetical protein